MRSRILASTFVLLIGVSRAVSFTYGQAVTGSFTGHVYDPSGAPVPNATVVATNVLTGIATTRSSDSAGLYLITNLLPGTYSVAVEAKGFKRFVQENIVLRVDSKMNIDAQLELGEITQEVTVSAAPPMLQTEKADVNVVLPEQTIENHWPKHYQVAFAGARHFGVHFPDTSRRESSSGCQCGHQWAILGFE
jgi:Carboxypeptidase regulatory-like domain